MKRSCSTCKHYMCTVNQGTSWCDLNCICFLINEGYKVCNAYEDSPSYVYDVSYIDENGIPQTDHVNMLDETEGGLK